ncbi:MAG: B12-binding domain-containing radical SAM protein, partial [Chloroflexi bacterium]|nr:B12-binding domain-containing radical SAM protein [Chloroflexota bacterium]
MRILFVYPNATNTEYISYGIAYLSANLKAHGHEAGLLDLTWGRGVRPAQVHRAIDETGPDLVAIGAMSVDYPLALEVARHVKAYRDLPVLVGGMHATVAPEAVIAEDVVDLIGVGESEEALVDLCDRWDAGQDIADTPNFWLKRNPSTGFAQHPERGEWTGQGGQVIRNAPRPLTQNLDSLPFPDRDLFEFDRYMTALNGQLAILATRGCPYSCTYCANNYLRRLYQGQKYVRSRSVENVIQEIEACAARYHVRAIDFMDDVFIANRRWILEFCETYAGRIRLPFRCGARVEYVNDEVCAALAAAGCTWLFMGIEAGDPVIRRDVMHRTYGDEQVVEAFRIARAHGLKVASFNMIGLPRETRDTMNKTVQLNKAVQPDDLRVSIFQPY